MHDKGNNSLICCIYFHVYVYHIIFTRSFEQYLFQHNYMNLRNKYNIHTCTFLWISWSRWCKTFTEPSHWLIKSWRSLWASLNIFAVRSNTCSSDCTSLIIWFRSWFLSSTSLHNRTRVNSSSYKTKIRTLYQLFHCIHVCYFTVQLHFLRNV